MEGIFAREKNLAYIVVQEWHWIAILLRDGFDYYQLAFLLKSAIVAHHDYDSLIPIVVSDLRACIEERLGGTAA